MIRASGSESVCNEEIEKAVLGHLLRFREKVPFILDGLTEEDFSSPQHRLIFNSIKSLHDKKSPIDHLTVSGQTKSKGWEIPPSELILLEEFSLDGKEEYDKNQLKIYSCRRKLQIALDRGLKQVQDPSVEYAELRENLQQEVLSILNDRAGSAPKIELPTFAELSSLDVKVEYLREGILPKQSITMIFGPGGSGKTYLCLQLGSCVADGKPFAGLPTVRTPTYYVDFENSLPTLCDRAKMLGPSSMLVWHISNPVPPPRLDSKDWGLFKTLPPGLLIIDTLRASHLLDENSSKDMALIMGRLKELREMGFTIVLIHHTPKLDGRIYKGSTAIIDLCDHALGLERVKAVGSDQTVDDDSEDLPFRLGVRQKTRYAPFRTFLTFDPSHGFSPADDPDGASLVDMKALFEEGSELTQTEFCSRAKAELGFTKGVFRRLLRKGTGSFWTETKGAKNTSFYRPISVFQQENQDSKTAFQKAQESLPFEGSDNTEFSSFPGGFEKARKTARVELSSFPPPLGVRKTRKTGQNLERSDYDDSDLPEGANLEFGAQDDLPFER